jgi:NitT/TauT family transport system ATP-binding protein
MKELMKMEGVSLTYYTKERETLAFENLNFSLKEGEFVAVVGPSGCGKTSLLSVIAGLIPPTKGRVTFPHAAGKKTEDFIGYMLQRDELFAWRSIRKNVLLPLEIKHALTDEKRKYADELLKKYGLWEFADYYPHQLSGGMKQRAALIRTLSFQPDLLLLDEPFSALDYQTRLNVCDDVYSIIKGEKKTALLVTHDIAEAISIADRILVLTKRPAKIKTVHTIPNEEGETPFSRRENKDFRAWFELLWEELNER